jgi:hypothetical protein
MNRDIAGMKDRVTRKVEKSNTEGYILIDDECQRNKGAHLIPLSLLRRRIYHTTLQVRD